MAASSAAGRHAPARTLAPGPGAPVRVSRVRARLGPASRTTVYIASFPRRQVHVKVHVLEQPQRLAHWCRAQGVTEAVVGGFFTRPSGVPLGEVRLSGTPHPTEPFAAPWHLVRAAVHVDGQLRIARRDELAPAPAGDLLQAGPLLVRRGRAVAAGDAEGFSHASHQFDSDITDGRYPRAALAVTARELLAVVCDGRSSEDAGMSLEELADFLVRRGARDALNLDGGGSASLVCRGRLLNRPREEHGIELLEGRPISTLLSFSPIR